MKKEKRKIEDSLKTNLKDVGSSEVQIGFLSKKIEMKFLPKVSFVSDKSFDYAEKIEKLIQKNK